ncbi:tetratricopeptide repeat protein [Streptomyces sp. NPDC096324]|uniref:tetratricopeptide repeat protein n=1 Tax=Streptomyces sp. NPDC096324 TaxID=3366085 RepID=UPI00381A23F4
MLIERVESALSVPDSPAAQVLCGLGGSGKTAIALELARGWSGRGRQVWWVDARQGSTLEAGLRAVARQADASEDQLRAGDTADVLWSCLARYERPWLLVVDNADDPALLDGPGRLSEGTGWIRPPATGRGGVLVTTRDSTPQTWGGACALHPVRPLTGENITDAARILHDHAGDAAGSFDDAQRLARRLGGLPLALRLAGTYLADANHVPVPYREPDVPMDFRSYQAALDRGLERVDPGSVIDQTWAMSLKLLEQRGMPRARPLLRLIATFADAPLPYTLLLTPETLAGAGELAELDGPGVWSLLTALAGLGLVDLQPATGSDALPALRVHPLVRDASRDHTALGTAVQALHSAAFAEETGIPEESDRWEHWAFLQPHAFDLFHRAAGSEPSDQTIAAATAANFAARHLRAKGLYRQARGELEAILAHQRVVLGDTHPDTLSTRHSLAGVLQDLGEVEQAGSELEAVLAHERVALGDTHPDTLITRHNLAGVLRDLGEVEQARSELEGVLAHQHVVLGDTHPSTLTTRHSLAGVLQDLGEVEQARSELEAVLAHERVALGDTHPETLYTRHSLAGVLQDLGEVEQARSEYEAVLAHRRVAVGDTHPSTLTTRHNLAGVLQDLGEVEQARSEYEAVLAHQHVVLGDTHPSTLTTRHNLAGVLQDLGEVEQARSEYEAVLAHRRVALGGTHPDTLITRHNLAGVLQDLGEVEQARSEYEAVLAHRRVALGDTHPSTLTTRHSLAGVLRDLGEVEQARSEYEAVLAHERVALGDTHQ